MEDVREPTSSQSNGTRSIARKTLQRVLSVRNRKRAGFSLSLSVQDLKELGVEKEKEKENEKEVEAEAAEEEVGMDESSPRGVIEDCLRSLESETDSSKPSTSDSDNHSNSKNSPHWRGFFKLLTKKSGLHLQSFPPLGNPKLTRRKSTRVRDNMVPALNLPLDDELSYFKSSWKNFTLSELQIATNNFSHENLIGEGGYSEVFKGHLEDGQHVAIKRLTGGTPEEMTADFLSELGIIVHADHPKIAKVIGYGVEGGMHLVLQLSPHGSLASLLKGSKVKLVWDIRYKIALGTAEGLLYLHEGCPRRIIHKDIKAANILLTEDFEAQIADFGLAKWLPDQWTHHVVSKFEGTFGYLPPEYFMHGIVDEKTDVYAYGVLLLELITGRLALDNSQQSLVMWAKPLLTKNSLSELVDPSLANSYDSEQMNSLVMMASFCINQSSIRRPQMSQVVQILRGEKGSLELVEQFQKPVLQRTYSQELLDAEDYNSTKYLNDLNQHMQIALGL